jgi:hypothetical protein
MTAAMKKIPDVPETIKHSAAFARMSAARHELYLAWTEWLRTDAPHMNDALAEADATNSVMRQLAGLVIPEASGK